MMNAILTYDFDLQYVQHVGSRRHAVPVQHHRDVERARGQHPAVARHPRGYTAFIMRRYRKRLDDPLVAWALVVMFVVTAFFFFVLALRPDRRVHTPVRPASPTARVRTRCCRTTSSCCSTRRSSTSATSASPCRSRSPSPRSITGRVGEGWLIETRRWALFAWGFLTRRHPPRRLVELRGARLERRVGAGTRSRTRASCRGSPAPRTSTRCWCRSGAACCACGTSRLLVATFALTILGTFLTRSRRDQQRARVRRRHRSGRTLLGFFGVIVVVSLGADRLARRPAAFARRDRLADLA